MTTTRSSERVASVVMASVLSQVTGGRAGGIFDTSGARAALVTVTPDLLARVEALPPLHGEPDVEVAEAIAEPAGDARRDSSVRRLLRRFRGALAVVAVFVVIDALTTLVGPLIIRHGLDAGVGEGDKRLLWEMVLAFLIVQIVSWVNQIAEMLLVSRTGERMLYTLRLRTFAHLQRMEARCRARRNVPGRRVDSRTTR